MLAGIVLQKKQLVLDDQPPHSPPSSRGIVRRSYGTGLATLAQGRRGKAGSGTYLLPTRPSPEARGIAVHHTTAHFSERRL